MTSLPTGRAPVRCGYTGEDGFEALQTDLGNVFQTTILVIFLKTNATICNIDSIGSSKNSLHGTFMQEFARL